MATAYFRPCPHCGTALSYLEGAASGSRTPRCPRCRKVVEVPNSTFLMLDTSRRAQSVESGARK